MSTSLHPARLNVPLLSSPARRFSNARYPFSSPASRSQLVRSLHPRVEMKVSRVRVREHERELDVAVDEDVVVEAVVLVPPVL